MWIFPLKISNSFPLHCFQTNVGGDYYTGEYDYTTVDGNQPETPTDTAGQGQVPFKTS